METNELKNIWNALANNNLVDKELAKENINQIITKKGNGLISKMKRKIMFDYIMYLVAMIAIPFCIVFMNFVLHRPSPILQLVGVFFIECYLIFMLMKSRNKILSLDDNQNTGTIRDALENFRNKYLRILKKERYIALIFGYFIISLALVQYFVHMGTVFPLNFNHISIVVPIILIIGLIFLPVILKIEYRTRFSRTLEEINHTINELDSE